MKRSSMTVSICVIALTLTACGGSDEAANTTAADNDMNAMMASSGPFGQIEMQMHDDLIAAVGVNVGDSWVRKMIEHHEGAVAMSRQALTMSPNAHVAQMAQSTIETQTAEIADLQKLIVEGTPDPASAEIYRPAIEQMHQAMMSASGADLSETFHRKMLAHHQGAVALSDIALANGVTGAIREQIEKTRAAQLEEIATIEAMLRGEPAPSAPAASEAEPSPAAGTPAEATQTARPAAPEPTRQKPAPAESAKPGPEPADPHAGHDMNSMNSM